MSEQKKKRQHDACMRRFIDLANEMKDEGVPVNIVSWSLMTASGIYATYSVAGNQGGLNPAGIDKVSEAYKTNLANIQQLKKAQGMSETRESAVAAGDDSASAVGEAGGPDADATEGNN